MAKRKRGCSLDDIVMEYLKIVKCKRTSTMFETERSSGGDHSKSLKKFIKFLKQKDLEKQNRIEDDLGFEINFGAFQPMIKVSFLEQSQDQKLAYYLDFKLPLDGANKTSKGPKTRTEKRKKDIPKEFIKKIKNLGMRVEDAEVLFKSKINWTAVYSENKIYCVEPGCDYFTMIDNGELTNHMIKVHKYGDYPCTNDHCDYIATSKVKLIFS